MSIIVIAFAISFRQWGIGNEINIGFGLTNFLLALLVVALSFAGRYSLQKIVGLGADYKVEFKLWSIGLLLTLLLAFISNGRLWFLIPGGIIINYMPGHRMGWVRYGLNFFGIGVIALAGPIANIIMAMIFRTLFAVTAIPIFHTAFLLNIIWAIWNILPIPPADGSRMFWGSRMVYMYGLAVVISSSILLFSNVSILITIPSAILLGVVWWLIYYIIYERFVWNGPF